MHSWCESYDWEMYITGAANHNAVTAFLGLELEFSTRFRTTEGPPTSEGFEQLFKDLVL